MIEEQRSDVLTFVPTFYKTSVLGKSPSNSKDRKLCDIGVFDFLIVRQITQLFQLQFMRVKRLPDNSTQPMTFYDLSVSCYLFSKAIIRQFGATGT